MRLQQDRTQSSPHSLGVNILDLIHETLSRILEAGKCEPYIRHIRFPLFRNLRRSLQIDFTHPITALVGPNGTNKTAMLRALQGCPDYFNVGNYWFSTKTDPIVAEEGTSHRFVHGYIAPSTGLIVESLKARIARGENPDYFEPSRPVQQDGMAKMPPIVEGEALPPERTKTRWKAIRKDVTYLDFRTELSAYDKYFYHVPAERPRASVTQRQRLATELARKKKTIRSRSPHLWDALQNEWDVASYYKRNRIIETARELSGEELEVVSNILGRRYDSIRVMTHDYFGVEGSTVLLRSFGLDYSEAFAGSGEFAIVMLATKVIEADPRSLILLDEPEFSLHPGAQHQLMSFLADQVKQHGHQVVMSTHSPEIVRDLPSHAIKVFQIDSADGKVDLVDQESHPSEAFFRLGVKLSKSSTIYVEDGLAAELVKRVLRDLGEAQFKRVEVLVLPGGASSIRTRFIPSFALSGRTNALVFLDGDQRPAKDSIDPDTVRDEDLRVAVSEQLGGKPQLSLDGANGRSSPESWTHQLRTVLTWVSANVDYLPGGRPENLLLIFEDVEGGAEDEDGKLFWLKRTKNELRRSDWEEVTSAEIMFEQKRAIARVREDHPHLVLIRERIRRFLMQND